MVDKKLSEFDAVSTGEVSYFPVIDDDTKNGKLAATKAMPWTNCITEIPQDIKLSLSSGTLTLAAGSKCYIKSDTTTPTFTIPTDKTLTFATNGTYFVHYDGTNIVVHNKTDYDYSTLPQYTTFPLCEITVSNGAISSIDKVFNGFGYIGLNPFVLPGVKCLIPMGRNSDGSLKNTDVEISSVKTFATSNGNRTLVLGSSALAGYSDTIYNEEKNLVTNTSGTNQGVAHVGNFVVSNNVITSFNIKTPMHAVDYSDLEEVKDELSTKVDLTSSQTISGQKITTAGNGWKINNTGITRGSVPSSTTWRTLAQMGDKNGSGYVQIGSVVTSDGRTGIYLQAYDFTSTTSNTATVNAYVESDGTIYGTAPTPSSLTDNSTKITTTAYLNNKFKVVSSLPSSPVTGVFYFVTG